MKKVKMLYVDDEVENLTGFRIVFRKDYDIQLASSAKEGLEILENQQAENPFQLVLTDQRMPKMTGVEMLKIVAEKYPKTIGIVVTGYADIDAVMSAINHGGVFRYISKPWEKDDLKEAIDEALVIYKLREENEILIRNLKTSEESMRSLLANIPGMAYKSSSGKNWKTYFASEGCFDLFGFTAEKFMEGKVSYTDLVKSEFIEPIRQEVENSIAEKRPFETQYMISTKNGEEKWVLERGNVIGTGEDDLPLLEGFVSDMTERKSLEIELKKATDRIEVLEKRLSGK